MAEKDTDTASKNKNIPADYNDPTSKLWSVYLNETSEYDKALVENWRRDMDGILIFSGLFAVVITAFIIDSYKRLSPDSGSIAVELLAQLSQQLAGASNGSHVAALVPPQSFQPSSGIVRVNVVWFLSLSLGLTCALSATLVQQWSRNYIQVITRRRAPHTKGRIRAFLYEGIQNFKMRTVVEGIPTLLHVAVFLFLGGLVDYLFPINTIVAHAVLGIVIIWTTFYFIISVLPAINMQCPYYTPLSGTLWRMRHILWVFWSSSGPGRHRHEEGYNDPFMKRWHNRVTGDIPDAQVSPDNYDLFESSARSVRAFRWTMESLIEDTEFEPFVEGIAEWLPFEYQPEFFMFRTVDTVILELAYDQEICLFPRIISLLTSNSGKLTEKQKDKRDITCMKAIASLISILDEYDHRTYRLISSWRSGFLTRFADLKRSNRSGVALTATSTANSIVAKLKEITYNVVYGNHAEISYLDSWPQAAWIIMEALNTLGSGDAVLNLVPTLVDRFSHEPSGLFKQCVSYLHRFLLPFYRDDNSKLGSAAPPDRQAFIVAFMKATYLTVNHFDYCQAPSPTRITPTYITQLLGKMQNDDTPLLARYANCVNARFACHLQGDIIMLYNRDKYADIPYHLQALRRLCVLDDLGGTQDLQRELTLWYSDMRDHARNVQEFWGAIQKPLSEYRSAMLTEESESFGKFQMCTTGGSVMEDFPTPGKVFLSQGYTVVLVTFLNSMTRTPLPDGVLEPTLDTLEFITRNLTTRFSSRATQQCLVDLVDAVTKSLLEDLGRRTEPNTSGGAVPNEPERVLPSNNLAYAEIPRSRNPSCDNLSSGSEQKYSMRAVPMPSETEQLARHAPPNIVKMIHALLQILSTIAHPDCMEDAKRIIQLVIDNHILVPDLARKAAPEALRKLTSKTPFEFSLTLPTRLHKPARTWPDENTPDKFVVVPSNVGGWYPQSQSRSSRSSQ